MCSTLFLPKNPNRQKQISIYFAIAADGPEKKHVMQHGSLSIRLTVFIISARGWLSLIIIQWVEGWGWGLTGLWDYECHAGRKGTGGVMVSIR